MHAQVKLTEMWKANNYKNYPQGVDKLKPASNGRITRGMSDEKLVEPSTLNTFIGNASRLWNKAPNAIKASISIAKNEIKKYCETLPI